MRSLETGGRVMPALLIRDAELVVTMAGPEIKGGWVAVRDGLVAASLSCATA